MKFALYGLPCSGKTTLMDQISDIKIVHGSDELKRMTKGKFSELSAEDKNAARKQYTEGIAAMKGAVLSDGHYSFLSEVVFTPWDAAVYDVFFYLYCKPEILAERYAQSQKNARYAKLSLERISAWQHFEMESLRNECHFQNKDFYAADASVLTADMLSDFLRKIEIGFSAYSLASSIVQKIKEKYPFPCKLHVIDGDKTFFQQDSLRLCAKDFVTHVFDGDFYTGFQSVLFAQETEKIDLDFTQLSKLERNPLVMEKVRDEPYFILSSGITTLWKRIGEVHSISNIIADPLISGDTKYYVVKLLREKGYTISAYGDSKNDLYMLQESDDGYLYIGQHLSRSLKSDHVNGIRLLYDKSPVILSQCEDLRTDISICKSDSGIQGSSLAAAHLRLGTKLGKIMRDKIPQSDTAVLVLERGGRFFGDGLYSAFGGTFYTHNSHIESAPIISQPFIIIVDSVINTGKSILKEINVLKCHNPEAEIFIAANVVQKEAVDKLSDYKIFTVRTSDNSFVGRNQSVQGGNFGPDTADRLFNLISVDEV